MKAFRKPIALLVALLMAIIPFCGFAESWICWRRESHDEKAASGTGEVLPGGHFTLSAALLPLYPNLFPIRAGGH